MEAKPSIQASLLLLLVNSMETSVSLMSFFCGLAIVSGSLLFVQFIVTGEPQNRLASEEGL